MFRAFGQVDMPQDLHVWCDRASDCPISQHLESPLRVITQGPPRRELDNSLSHVTAMVQKHVFSTCNLRMFNNCSTATYSPGRNLITICPFRILDTSRTRLHTEHILF